MTGVVKDGDSDTEEYGHRSEGSIAFATCDQNGGKSHIVWIGRLEGDFAT